MDNIYEQYKKDHMPEDNNKPVVEYYGFEPKAKAELAYLGKSANVGWKKGVDQATVIAKNTPLDMVISDEYSEERKQLVLDAMRERDIFYVENENDISGATRLIGGMVETITNPIDIGVQIGIAAATGGSSIPVQLGAQAGTDLIQANAESLRYENRLQTPKENLVTIATSIGPDLLAMGAGAAIRKTKSNMLKESVVSGDININVRKGIAAVDDIGLYEGAKAQQMYTDFPEYIKPDVDPYKVGAHTDYVDPAAPKIVKPEDVLLSDSLLGLGDITNGIIKEKPKSEFKNTYLQRLTTNFNDNSSYLSDTLNSYGIDFKADAIKNLDNKYGKNFHNKSDIQKLGAVYNHNNTTVEDFVAAIKPTVDDYYDRWKLAKAKNPESNPRLTLHKGQIDEALIAIDTKFNTQKLYIQNEYMNIINKGYDKTPVTLNEYLDGLGKEDKSVAKQWINGIDNNTVISGDRNGFLNEAYKDSIILDEFNQRRSLFDLKDYDNLQSKYGSIFDKDGDIIFDTRLLDVLQDARGADKKFIIGAMRENPASYVEFIYHTKRALNPTEDLSLLPERVRAIKEAEINWDKNAAEEFFGVAYPEVERYAKKHSQFINDEYNRITNEMGVTLIDRIRQRVAPNGTLDEWKYKATDYTKKNKKELAIESVKINQSINKQSLIGDLEKSDIATILPFYEDGTFKIPTDVDLSKPLSDKANIKVIKKSFNKFVQDLKKTRQSARLIGEYKSIGELRPYFGDNKMASFFTGYKDGQFLKTNAEMVRDIFDRNTSSIARLSEYGSTSPYALLNKFRYKLNQAASKIYGDVLSDAQKQVLNTASIRAETMLSYAQTGFRKELPDIVKKGSGLLRNTFRRGLLSGSGGGEFAQNYFIALQRAQKYAGFSIYKDASAHYARKVGKRVSREFSGDLPNAKYHIAQLRKNVDFKRPSYKTKWEKGAEKFDDIAFSIQELSQKHMNLIGESFSTSIIHHLPDNYSLLENEMKDLLRIKGVTNKNYKGFIKYAKNHIDNNGLTVDMYRLSQEIDFGNNEYANILRNLHYQLTDYMSNPDYKAKFKSAKMDEASQWYGLFRAFSRAMNLDMLDRMLHYVNANGVSKSRFSLNYIPDRGVGGVAKDMGLFGTGFIMLGIGGYAYTIGQEMLYSDRSVYQKWNVIKAHTSEIIDLLQDKDVLGFAKKYADITGINPIDIIRATDVPTAVITKGFKIFDTLTDEEKKAFGTNKEEAAMGFIELVIDYAISQKGSNFIESLYKTYTEQDVETLGKVYGLSKKGQEIYEAGVRNDVSRYNKYYEDKDKYIREFNNELNYNIKLKKAEIDYETNSNDSYNQLSQSSKNICETIIANNDIKDKDDCRQEYAIIWNVSPDKETAVEALANSRQEDNIDVQGTIEVLNNQTPTNAFEELSPKRQDLFYLIMNYKGVEHPTEDDYHKYIELFKDANDRQVKRLLREHYNIDDIKLIRAYSDKDTRTKVLSLYK